MTNDLDLEARITAQMIEQEHRLIPAIRNYIETRHLPLANPRRRATLIALAWIALSRLGFGTIGVTGLVAAVLGFLQLGELTRQNSILARQADMAAAFNWTTRQTELKRILADATLPSGFRSSAVRELVLSHLRRSVEASAASDVAIDDESLLASCGKIDLDLNGALLNDVVLRGMCLNGVSFQGASFAGAHFERMSFVDVDFESVNLEGSEWKQSSFDNVSFFDLQESSADLPVRFEMSSFVESSLSFGPETGSLVFYGNTLTHSNLSLTGDFDLEFDNPEAPKNQDSAHEMRRRPSFELSDNTFQLSLIDGYEERIEGSTNSFPQICPPYAGDQDNTALGILKCSEPEAQALTELLELSVGNTHPCLKKSNDGCLAARETIRALYREGVRRLEARAGEKLRLGELVPLVVIDRPKEMTQNWFVALAALGDVFHANSSGSLIDTLANQDFASNLGVLMCPWQYPVNLQQCSDRHSNRWRKFIDSRRDRLSAMDDSLVRILVFKFEIAHIRLDRDLLGNLALKNIYSDDRKHSDLLMAFLAPLIEESPPRHTEQK